MKKIFITGMFTLFLTGCQQTAKLENIKIGMSLSDVKAMAPLERVAEDQNNTVYRCWVDVGAKAMIKYGSVMAGSEPYLLTFDNNSKLVHIVFDNNESTRMIIKRR